MMDKLKLLHPFGEVTRRKHPTDDFGALAPPTQTKISRFATAGTDAALGHGIAP